MWQIERERVAAGTDFIFLGSKCTVDSDCSHGIKRHLLLGRNAATNLDRVLKSRDHFADKSSCSQSYGFSSSMCGYESWTIKNLGAEELMLLKCGIGEDS